MTQFNLVLPIDREYKPIQKEGRLKRLINGVGVLHDVICLSVLRLKLFLKHVGQLENYKQIILFSLYSNKKNAILYDSDDISWSSDLKLFYIKKKKKKCKKGEDKLRFVS